MYAVFETGGKQYKAEKGAVVFVEKLAEEPGKAVSFDALVISDGDNVTIGTPTVKGAKVKAKVVEHGKEKKVVVFKYKAKKDYRRKQGHRQPFTKIEITGISTGKAGEEQAEEKPAAKAAATAVKTEAVKPAAKTTAAKTEAAKPAAKSTATKTAAAKPAAKATATKTAAAKPAAKATATKTAAAKPAAKATTAKTTAAKPAAKKAADKPADEKPAE